MSRFLQCNCKHYLLNLHFVNLDTLLIHFPKQFRYLCKEDCLFINNLRIFLLILRLTGSKRTCPLNSFFLFNITAIMPLLSAGLGSDLQLLSISVTGILHTLPLTFGDWPLGMTVNFLNKFALLLELFLSVAIFWTHLATFQLITYWKLTDMESYSF